MKTLHRLFLLAIACLVVESAADARQVEKVEMTPQSLTCEDMKDPSSLEISNNRNPRFSWINVPTSDTLKGKRQTAYEIRVATSK